MIADENEWSFFKWNREEFQLQLNNEEYELDANTAAICHSLLLVVDAINNKKNGCRYGKEMDSRCNKASRGFEGNSRC